MGSRLVARALLISLLPQLRLMLLIALNLSMIKFITTAIFKYDIMIIILLYFFLFLIQGALTPITIPTVVPSIAGATSPTYSFALSASGQQLPVSTSLIIQFLSQYVITAASNCALSINNSPNTSSCSTPGLNQIVFTNIVTSTTALNNLTVSFNSNGAQYAGNTNIMLYFISDGVNITEASGVVSVTITPASLASCFASSNNDMVGEQGTWTLGFTPSLTLNPSNFLKLTFNLKLNSASNFLNASGIICSRGSCTYSLSSNSESLNVVNLFSSPTLTSQSLDISTMENPYSTYPITILYQVMYNNQYEIQRCEAKLTLSNPSNAMSFSLQPPLSQVISSVNNNIRINLAQRTPVPTGGYYLISSPLSISYTPQNLLGTLPNSTIVSGGILIGNLSSSVIENFYSLGTFVITNPVSTQPVPIIVSSLIIVNSIYYKISEATINVTPSASNITVSNVVFTPKNANQISTYSLSFTTINNLVLNSFVVIKFPPEIKVNSNSTCVSLVGTCSADPNLQSINLSLNSALAAPYSVGVNITNVLNPYNTIPSSSFTISSYYNNSDSLVDTLTSGLTIKSDPNQISSVTLNASNQQTGALASYQFSVKFTNTPLANSVLVLVFPIAFNITGVTSNICNLIVSGNTVILSNCFDGSVDQIKVNLSLIRNPLTTQPVMITNISLFYNNSIVEYLSQPIQVRMNTLATLTASISASNSTVHANSSYLFTLVFSLPHASNDVVIITIPPTRANLSNPQCSIVSGFSSINCTLVNSNLSLQLGFNPYPSNNTISFRVSTFQNNWFVSTALFPVTTLSNGYQMETGTAQTRFEAGSLSVTVSNDNVVLLSNSTITFTITPPFTINQNASILIALPSAHLNASICNSTNNSNCQVTNNILNISQILNYGSPLIVSVTADTGYFTVTPMFPITLYFQNEVVAFNSNVTVSVYCDAPCKECQSTNKSSCKSCLPSLYTALTYLVVSTQTCASGCPASTYLSNLSCLSCSPTCLNCSTLSTQCTSCKSGTYLYNNSCPGSCPDGTYSSINSCEVCNPSCKACTSLSQCTSCPSGSYLFNEKCVGQCPATYYPDNNSNCQSCGICQICTNLGNCSLCKENYYLLNSRCYESCPNTYPIPSQSTCLACDPTCLSCQNTIINCINCDSGRFLHNNKCLLSCPQPLVGSTLTNKCQSVDQSMILFPGVISSSALVIIVVFSRVFFKSTSVTTSLVGLLAYPQFIIYCYYTYLVSVERRRTESALALSSLVILLVLSISFIIVCIKKIHQRDQYFKHWYNSHKVVSWVLNIISCLNYKAYRLSYSRIFNLEALSSCFKSHLRILYLSTGVTIGGTVLVEILMSISCITTLYLSTTKNQVFYQSIDTIVVSGVIGLVAIIDIPKTDDYFMNSSFLTNRVHVLDAKNSIIDEVEDLGENREYQHESGYGKVNRSGYVLQSGNYFENSTDKIKLGDESIGESLNTGMINFQSDTLKNLNEKEKQLSAREGNGQDVLGKDDGLVRGLNQSGDELDESDDEQALQDAFGRKSLKSSPQSLKSSKVSERQKMKEEMGFEEEISQIKSVSKKKKLLNIFDPIQEQTEEELLNQLESFGSSEVFGDKAYRRPNSQNKNRNDSPLKTSEYKRSTISVFNNRELKQKWNNIIKSKIQTLKGLNQEPKPIINEISESESRREGVYKRKRLKRPKKQYHNKQLQGIYLQRIAPVKSIRSGSAKPTFRASKYNL